MITRVVMRLSTLWKVDREITADGRNPIAEEVVRRWRHDAASVRFFRSSANFVYTVGADRSHFLRFADDSERSRDVIEAELELLSLLEQTGAPVAVPVPSRAGKLVETVATASGTFHGCVFPAHPGRQLDFDDLDLPQFSNWGLALGGLHATLSSCVEVPAARRPSWNERMVSLADHLDDGGPVGRELNRVLSALEELPVTKQNYGLVHGDFELDNVFWKGGTIAGIVDFDDSSRDWYVADIAYALRDLFVDGLDPGDERLKAFLAGYRQRFELDETPLGALPTFIAATELLQYARIARALDLRDDRDYPEWLTRLAHKLERRMARYAQRLANG